MEERDFEQVVDQVIDTIPAELWARVENLQISVEDQAADDPEIYGWFDGVPLPERGSFEPAFEAPATITIYRVPLVRDFGAAGVTKLREQIRITVLHELGHYFGLDEDRLDELGYA